MSFKLKKVVVFLKKILNIIKADVASAL